MELLLNDLESQGWSVPLKTFFKLAVHKSEDCAISLLRRGYYPPHQNRFGRCFETAAHKGYIQLMKLLVQLNPMFLQKKWLVANCMTRDVRIEIFPQKLTQHKDFVSWLVQHRSRPAQLTALCRSVILVQLGPNYIRKVKDLPLPEALKTFLCIVGSALNSGLQVGGK